MSMLYSVLVGIILISFSPILYALEKNNIEPNWLYNINDKVNKWFNEKTND